MSKQNSQLPIQSLLSQEKITERFEELLGKKSQGFISTLIQVVNSNYLLKDADRTTILNAAAMAASMDLSINPNLGFAYLIPYKNNKKGIVECQFQIGSKGLVQLAHRTQLYTFINAVEIWEDNFVSWNPATEEIKLDYSKAISGKVVGYFAMFRLSNGFEKKTYWDLDKVQKHAQRYSKSWGQKTSSWTTNFDAMAKKTVLKSIIRGFGPMSVDMENAVLSDQSVITEDAKFDYVDNPKGIEIDSIDMDKEKVRCLEFMKKAKTADELAQCESSVDALGLRDDFDMLMDNFREAK